MGRDKNTRGSQRCPRGGIVRQRRCSAFASFQAGRIQTSQPLRSLSLTEYQ